MKTEPKTQAILGEILMERHRQDRKYGEQNHPDLPPSIVGRITGTVLSYKAAEHFGIPAEPDAQKACEGAFKSGYGNWGNILVEELAEVIEAAAMADSKGLREELVQVAGVCVAWIECIDRRTENAKTK